MEQKALTLDELVDKIMQQRNMVTSEEMERKLIKEVLQENLNYFRYVKREIPPINTDLLVVSPDGDYYIASWRPSYSIFTCQEKSESSLDWQWKFLKP